SEIIDIKSSSKERIKKLEGRVAKLEEDNKVFKELHSKADTAAPVVDKEKSFKQGRIIAKIDKDVEINLEEAQAKQYKIDLKRPKKVLSMQDVDEEEPAEVEEVLKVVKAAKLMTEVVTTARKLLLLKHQRLVFQGKEGVLLFKTLWKNINSCYAFKEAHKREGKSLEKEVTKKQRMDEEAEDLKSDLQIVANDDDDVYTKSTPLASKIHVVDYKIHFERNKTYFKIISADERFEKTKPKNYSDDYLLKTLKIMFEKPDVKASVWKDQKGKYGLAKRYPLTHFTLEQMLNNVRLEVEEVSEMSLELLRLVRRQLIEGYVPA
nr:hypothetical protein [Tanacetum cinerariifolium]